jgi:hypothetical protein
MIMITNLADKDKCPKCGTKMLERDPEGDPEGDMHCWGCGTTFIQGRKVAVEKPQPIVKFPKKATPKIEQTTHRKIDLIALHLETVTYHSIEPSQPPTKPIKLERRGRKQGEKVGHYTKVSHKVDEVISLYNDGYGIYPIMQELNLAKNTVRKILQENKELVNYAEAKKLKRDRIKRSKQTIIHALIGLASSAKSSDYSYEWMFEHAEDILVSYFKKDPVGTVKALVGDKTFTVDDLLKKTYEVILAQRLRLDDTFIEVEEGVFKLA